MSEIKEPTLSEIELAALELHGIEVIDVIDQETYDSAVELRTRLYDEHKRLMADYEKIKTPVHEELTKLHSFRSKTIDPIKELYAKQGAALVRWDNEQQRLRREEQARLEAEAERKRREDAAKLAEQLKARGLSEVEAEEVIESAVVHTPVVAAPTYEKRSDVVMKDNWQGEVTDLSALIKFCATKDGKRFQHLLKIDTQALNSLAKSLKSTMNIPGVRAVNNRIAATGRR